jgi:hypothetical protein
LEDVGDISASEVWLSEGNLLVLTGGITNSKGGYEAPWKVEQSWTFPEKDWYGPTKEAGDTFNLIDPLKMSVVPAPVEISKKWNKSKDNTKNFNRKEQPNDAGIGTKMEINVAKSGTRSKIKSIQDIIREGKNIDKKDITVQVRNILQQEAKENKYINKRMPKNLNKSRKEVVKTTKNKAKEENGTVTSPVFSPHFPSTSLKHVINNKHSYDHKAKNYYVQRRKDKPSKHQDSLVRRKKHLPFLKTPVQTFLNFNNNRKAVKIPIYPKMRHTEPFKPSPRYKIGMNGFIMTEQNQDQTPTQNIAPKVRNSQHTKVRIGDHTKTNPQPFKPHQIVDFYKGINQKPFLAITNVQKLIFTNLTTGNHASAGKLETENIKETMDWHDYRWLSL